MYWIYSVICDMDLISGLLNCCSGEVCLDSDSIVISDFSSVVEEKFVGIVTTCVGVLHDVTRIPVDDDPLLQLE